MTSVNSILLSTIKYVLSGVGGSALFDEGTDYDALYRLAKRHGVACTIADAVCQAKGVPDDIKRKFEKERLIIIAQQVLCDRAAQEIYANLDRNQIRGVVLKGTLLKSLYPQPYYRSMSDIDIYVEEADIQRMHPLMMEAGYHAEVIGVSNHYEYMRDNMVTVEFHPDLESLDSEYGRRILAPKHPQTHSISEIMDIWAHTLPVEGHGYVLQMEPEYHYVYVILHMLKHFLGSGTGIRSVMDVWVMNKHYAGKWDRDVINDLLENFGLQGFEKYSVALAGRWFGPQDAADVSSDVDEQALDAFESYILGSGTYGIIDNSIASRMEYKSDPAAKVRFFLKVFFLPYDAMKNQYPLLRKAPVLLPVMWVYRAFDIMINRRASAKHKIDAVLHADEAKGQAHKQMLEKVLKQ